MDGVVAVSGRTGGSHLTDRWQSVDGVVAVSGRTGGSHWTDWWQSVDGQMRQWIFGNEADSRETGSQGYYSEVIRCMQAFASLTKPQIIYSKIKSEMVVSSAG